MTQQLFNRREFIPPYTDVLWRIERGAVRTLTWSSSGKCIILGYWGAGDIVGQPLSKSNLYQIECLTSVKVTILPPMLWSQALDALFLHIQQAEEIFTIVQQHPMSLRLWQFLVWLADKFGRDVYQGRLIDLQLTHQELADAISITRVTVTRLLRQFESSGILRRHQKQFILQTRHPQCLFSVASPDATQPRSSASK